MQNKDNRQTIPDDDEKVQAYEKKPIYTVMRAVLRDTNVLVSRMDRGFKYSLGETLRSVALASTEAIFLAYEEREDIVRKASLIRSISHHLQRLLINYRISDELALIPRKSYLVQVERIVSAMRQQEGWLRSIVSQFQNDNGQNQTGLQGGLGVPLSRTVQPMR